MAPDIGGNHAGVNAVGRHVVFSEAFCQMTCVKNITELAEAVALQDCASGRGTMYVVEVQRGALVVRHARDVDDSRTRGLLEGLEEQFREQEVAEVVDSEGELESLTCFADCTGYTSVVDEHMKRNVFSQEVGCALGDAVEICEI